MNNSQTLFFQLKEQIINAIAKIFGDEFSLFDMCSKGYDIEIGPYRKTFFEGKVHFMLGPVPMYFGKQRFIICTP